MNDDSKNNNQNINRRMNVRTAPGRFDNESKKSNNKKRMNSRNKNLQILSRWRTGHEDEKRKKGNGPNTEITRVLPRSGFQRPSKQVD